MDWQALRLSLMLAGVTVAVLLPVSVLLGRWLAFAGFRGRSFVEALVTLPLVLPPSVIGFYLLSRMGPESVAGRAWAALFGSGLVFTFEAVLIASIIVNLPFAVQPAQRAFENIGHDLRDAAATCGHSAWRSFTHVELPLAWPGIATGAVLAFAHTLGEFGVVLMVGGSIPGETRTLALSIYDRVQAFDMGSANRMATMLMAISLIAVALTLFLSQGRHRRG